LYRKVTTPANWENIEFELNNDILSFVYDQYDILEMIKSYKLDENLNNIIKKGEIDFKKLNFKN
jgi:hypothetical protein